MCRSGWFPNSRPRKNDFERLVPSGFSLTLNLGWASYGGHAMSKIEPKDQPQPSLLNRLDGVVLTSENEIRESAIKDLQYLMSATNKGSVIDAAKYPHVAKSVVNYGMPALSGIGITAISAGEIERQVRQAILDFEPRIDAKSLSVKLNPNGNDPMNLQFEIECVFMVFPWSLPMLLSTKIDRESGNASISEITNQQS